MSFVTQWDLAGYWKDLTHTHTHAKGSENVYIGDVVEVINGKRLILI